jgi:Tesmin/TSO1-like CXC domain, cysteine-rich domain
MLQQQTHPQQQRVMDHSLHMPPSAYPSQPRHRYPAQYVAGRPTSQYPPLPLMAHSYTIPPTHYAQVMGPSNQPMSRSMGGDANHFSGHHPSHYVPFKQQRFSQQGPEVSPDVVPHAASVVVQPHITDMTTKPSLSHQPSPSLEGCKCRRSYCLKKYCECYQKSSYCSGVCKCMNCYNFEGSPLYTMVDRPVLRYRPEHPVMTMMVPPAMSQPASHRVSLGSSAGMMEPNPAPPTLREDPSAQDDEAMMQAAMAMTELLNGFTSNKERKDPPLLFESTDSSEDITSSEPTAKRPFFESQGSVRITKKSKVEEYSIGFDSNKGTGTSPTEQASPHLTEKPCVRDEAPPSRPSSSTSVFHNRTLPTTRPLRSSVVEGHNSVYEEVTRSSGLPKSLSFRKICSRCGKPRSEHGENGFGNKCVYQECGKCGASVHQHAAAGHVMGVLCQMSVQEGAVAGAAACYDRKIRELAKRADLQRGHRLRQQEATSVEILLHPAATITSPRATTMAQ